jgi:hypothetical protein
MRGGGFPTGGSWCAGIALVFGTLATARFSKYR